MDSDAIAKLYTAYSRQVYLYILSLCGNNHMAEDIMQEAFVKAMLSLECSQGNVQGWLFRVCRNLWIDSLRKSKHFSPVELDKLYAEDPSSDVLQSIIQTEESRRMYKTIISMRHSFREVLILYYYLELPQNKISEVLNISNGAVRTLLYRARKELKTLMEDD
jgi:RNA polymerase sigma-70 factor, ECF subfamily